MGCFSFICQECEKPILSNAFRGQKVKLFLLKDGKVLEQMEGDYDAYGCVFDTNKKSRKWRLPWSEFDAGENTDTDTVCGLMDKGDKDGGNGIAAVHSACWRGVTPIVQSDDDPDQGWTDTGPYALGNH